MKVKELIGKISKKYKIREFVIGLSNPYSVGAVADNKNEYCLIVLGELEDNITKEQIELLKDLYFEV